MAISCGSVFSIKMRSNISNIFKISKKSNTFGAAKLRHRHAVCDAFGENPKGTPTKRNVLQKGATGSQRNAKGSEIEAASDPPFFSFPRRRIKKIIYIYIYIYIYKMYIFSFATTNVKSEKKGQKVINNRIKRVSRSSQK